MSDIPREASGAVECGTTASIILPTQPTELEGHRPYRSEISEGAAPAASEASSAEQESRLTALEMSQPPNTSDVLEDNTATVSSGTATSNGLSLQPTELVSHQPNMAAHSEDATATAGSDVTSSSVQPSRPPELQDKEVASSAVKERPETSPSNEETKQQIDASHEKAEATSQVELGKAGGSRIRALLSCAPPRQVIPEFQASHSPSNPTFPLPILDLLDHLGTPRSELFEQLMRLLRENLIKRIQSQQLSVGELDQLLVEIFPYISFPELRPAALAILAAHPSVPTKFLQKLSRNQAVFNACPLSIKRKVWEKDEIAFKSAFFSLFNKFVSSQQQCEANKMLPDIAFVNSRRRREHNPTLQQLLSYIGRSAALYNKVVSCLRQLYVSTNNTDFCILRAEIPMAFHDLNLVEVYDEDPCHGLAWCLDACIGCDRFEPKRLLELQSCFEQYRSGSVLGDLAMILNNPYSAYTIIRCIYTLLEEAIGKEQLPSENRTIEELVSFLSFGMKAARMIRNNKFRRPKSQVKIISRFLPSLMTLMIDDQLRDMGVEVDSIYKDTSDDATKTAQEGVELQRASDERHSKLVLKFKRPRTITSETPSSSGTSENQESEIKSTVRKRRRVITEEDEEESSIPAVPSQSTSPAPTSQLKQHAAEQDQNVLSYPKGVTSFYQKSSLARKLFLHYILTRMRNRDIFRINQFIRFIEEKSFLGLSDEGFTQSAFEIALEKTHVKNLVIDKCLLPATSKFLSLHIQFVHFLLDASQILSNQDLIAYAKELSSQQWEGEELEMIRQAHGKLVQQLAHRLPEEQLPRLYKLIKSTTTETAAGMN